MGALLVVVLVVLALIWLGGTAVVNWAGVQIETAKANSQARQYEAAARAADARAAQERAAAERARAAAEREQTLLERDRQRGINQWIGSLSFRMDVASLLPFWPVVAVLLVLAPLGGYVAGMWLKGGR